MKCWECEIETENIHHHHVIPRSRGGTKTVPLCQPCHSKAHHMKKNMTVSALTKAALAKKKKRGERLGQPPATLRVVGGLLLPTEETADLIKAIEMRRAGAKYREIMESTGWTLNKVGRVCVYWKGKEEELYEIWERRHWSSNI